jgi:hypothetical protein
MLWHDRLVSEGTGSPPAAQSSWVVTIVIEVDQATYVSMDSSKGARVIVELESRGRGFLGRVKFPIGSGQFREVCSVEGSEFVFYISGQYAFKPHPIAQVTLGLSKPLMKASKAGAQVNESHYFWLLRLTQVHQFIKRFQDM